MSNAIRDISSQPFLFIEEDMKGQGSPFYRFKTLNKHPGSAILKVSMEMVTGGKNGKVAKHSNRGQIRRSVAEQAYTQQIGGDDARLIRRVFVETPGCESYAALGWVLSMETVECMMCAAPFGTPSLH